MIRVKQLINRPEMERSLALRVSEIAGVTIPVRDLERAIDFYKRIFGFCVAQEGRSATRRSVTLSGPGEALLAIHEYGEAALRPVPLQTQWGFLVDELDRVREMIWDLGVAVASDSGGPDHIWRWTNGRSLCIHDPDGNEIHLVEESAERLQDVVARRCRARAALRRWVRPECQAAR